MSHKKIIEKLQDVRFRIDTMKADDNDPIISIGADLEALLNDTSEHSQESYDALIGCLQALQAIFQGETANRESLVSMVSNTIVAVEQVLGSGDNPISQEALKGTYSALNKELGQDTSENETDSVEPEEIVSPPNESAVIEKPETLNDLALSLMNIDREDKENLDILFDSLRDFSDKEEDVSKRKALVKAARSVKKFTCGKTEDFDEMMETVGDLIDSVNQEADHEENVAADSPETIEETVQEEPIEEVNIEESIETPEEIENIETPNEEDKTVHEPDVFADDTDESLVADFVVESKEMLEDSESSLLVLESDPDDLENVDTVFRAFHTIKGSAAYLGLKKLTELAHLSESLLSRMRDKEIRCSGGYADLTLHSCDMLKEMLDSVNEALSGSSMELPANYGELIHILKSPEDAGINKNERFAGFTAAEEESDSNQTTGTKKKSTSNTSESSVRVRTDRLDSLIDNVGELVIAQSMLTQDTLVLTGEHIQLRKKIAHTGKIVRELQDLSMAMRMIPLKGTFQKMARIVRDLSTKHGKQIEFVTEGEDTEIDRNMVDLIADPLVHMVRNAVDHGVEQPDVRTASGKSEAGTVRLKAYHSGGNVIVELSDDGAGLDRDKLIEKAVSKNLIESDKGMSENEIYQLIFAPGFSTADQVTDLSGRGVGMDVVRRNIEAMRGRVEISSEKGNGSVFKISLPLTLAITDGMLVKVGDERFVVPTISIHLSFQPKETMLSSVAGRGELVSLRGELMPVFRLHNLFNVKNAIEDPTKGLLMIVAEGKKRCALLVDELLGQHQVVAKSLGPGVGKISGVSGGAILGDGCVGLILDTAEVVTLARQNSNTKEKTIDPVKQAA